MRKGVHAIYRISSPVINEKRREQIQEDLRGSQEGGSRRLSTGPIRGWGVPPYEIHAHFWLAEV